MWVFTSNGAISIVEDQLNQSCVLARSRVKKHLACFLPKYLHKRIEYTPGHDYHYRIQLQKEMFSEIMADHALNIDYGNFKNSVEDDDFHEICSTVWWTMFQKYGGYGGKRDRLMGLGETITRSSSAFRQNRKRDR